MQFRANVFFYRSKTHLSRAWWSICVVWPRASHRQCFYWLLPAQKKRETCHHVSEDVLRGNTKVWQISRSRQASTQIHFSMVTPKLKTLWFYSATILDMRSIQHFFALKSNSFNLKLRKYRAPKKALFSACLQDSKTKNHEQKPAQSNGSKFGDQRGQQIEIF